MIRHEYKRKTAKKRSLKSLGSYLDYLADTNEKDHGPKGMVLLPGRNRLCEDDSPKAFISAVRDQHRNYLKVRDGLSGKRSAILWEEIIYCLGKGVHHSQEERDYIEHLIISRILPDSPSRPTWHMNPKSGMDDLHIPFSAKTRRGKMTLARTEVSLAKRLRALDQEIADYLNGRTHPKRKHVIKSASRVAEEKAEKRHRRRGVPLPCPLPEQLAKLADNVEITLERILAWLRDLNITYELTKNLKGLKLTYPKLRKAGKKYRNSRGSYPIRELVLLIKESRFDLDLVKCPEKYQPTVTIETDINANVTVSPVLVPVPVPVPVPVEYVTPNPINAEPITTPELATNLSEVSTEIKNGTMTKKATPLRASAKSKDKSNEMGIN